MFEGEKLSSKKEMDFFTILLMLFFMVECRKLLDDKNEKFIELERHQDITSVLGAEWDGKL